MGPASRQHFERWGRSLSLPVHPGRMSGGDHLYPTVRSAVQAAPSEG
jgi:hypothetical protein